MNPNPTPKASFLADNRSVQLHRQLLENSQLDVSLNISQLEMMRRLGEALSPDDARASHYKMAGVIQFLDIFRNLSEQPIPKKPTTNHQLE